VQLWWFLTNLGDMVMTTSIMNVLKPGTYINGAGETVETYTQVAVAFTHKAGNGCTVKIPEGVFLTGDILVVPQKERVSNTYDS
jgi:hypothetical protein